MKENISLECLLRINDDKGRVNIPSNVRHYLELEENSHIKLTYLKVDKEKPLLPFEETSHLDKQYRFQTTANTRNYLELEKGFYFKALLEKF
jgi:cupin superfamily acireductone dioxygenase involved in methionine salvage|tara:strand:- start:1168 stop:1443 length:276 start_codon:yes stop_codon:yes gene_type:complete